MKSKLRLFSAHLSNFALKAFSSSASNLFQCVDGYSVPGACRCFYDGGTKKLAIMAFFCSSSVLLRRCEFLQLWPLENQIGLHRQPSAEVGQWIWENVEEEVRSKWIKQHWRQEVVKQKTIVSEPEEKCISSQVSQTQSLLRQILLANKQESLQGRIRREGSEAPGWLWSQFNSVFPPARVHNKIGAQTFGPFD